MNDNVSSSNIFRVSFENIRRSSMSCRNAVFSHLSKIILWRDAADSPPYMSRRSLNREILDEPLGKAARKKGKPLFYFCIKIKTMITVQDFTKSIRYFI